jgi:hypothetical protein
MQVFRLLARIVVRVVSAIRQGVENLPKLLAPVRACIDAIHRVCSCISLILDAAERAMAGTRKGETPPDSDKQSDKGVDAVPPLAPHR